MMPETQAAEGAQATDPFRLDRRAMRRAFDRASSGYEAAATLQARVNEELRQRVAWFGLGARDVLDLGAGTGVGARELKRLFPPARVIALDVAPGMLRQMRHHQRLFRRFAPVCADAVRLPFAAATFDLVFSSLMLQWCDRLDVVVTEIRRVLKPEGLLAFSTFGPDTLKELRSAWSAADQQYVHVNAFPDMHDVGTALMRAGLTEPVLDVDRLCLGYPDVPTLMRDLKSIGAHNVAVGRARGLTGRGTMRRVHASYEALRASGSLPATFEIIYGAAWGAAGRAARSMSGEIRIAPDAIGRRER